MASIRCPYASLAPKKPATDAVENSELVAAVANHYALAPVTNAHFVPGGLLHRLMRLETENGSWALKILSRRALAHATGRARLERAEIVARLAAEAGIPAMTAQPGPEGHFLQDVTDRTVVLYPWRAGHILPPHAVSPAVASQMGGYLARLHALEIRFPDQEPPIPEAFASGHWEALAEAGHQNEAVWSTAVREALPRLTAANAKAMQAQLTLRDGWVTGHLDYDQKNVLWNEGGEATILDWEAAKPIHPALEAMGAGLSWAGQSAGATNETSFKAFLKGYRLASPLRTEDLETACDAVLGKWLIWLEFNLQRSLETEIQGTPEASLTQDALFHALGATLKLQADGDKYRLWVKNEGVTGKTL